MRIATFNINNVNKRLANLLGWLKAAKPDVVCLQELKATDRNFPRAALEQAGYAAVWRGQSAWNGVAILARGAEPVLTRSELAGDDADTQSRYIEAAVNGILIASLYAPNGNPQPGPKFAYKLAWMERLTEHARSLLAADIPVVLAGDFNVVPTDFDIYPSKSYAKNALVQPQSRALFARLLAQGWTDAIRVTHPDAPMYTFWDYMRNRWPRDAGLRLDHLLLSPRAADRLDSAGVDRDVRGRTGASDHAPAWIVLREKPTPRRSAKKKAKAPSRKAVATRTRARPKTRGPLLVIDGDSFAHRSYHALPKTILTRRKRPAGAILGFANFLLRIYQAEAPRAVVVCWDTLGKPTYRTKALPGYQGGRKFDDAIIEQLKVIPDFVTACGFVNAKGAGYEADDFLAAAVAEEEKRRGHVIVASGDRDAFQLASPRTTIVYPVRAGETARIGPAQVRERYGVDPVQVADFIALRGDPSDKIPGAPGLGAEGAASLLRRHGSLEAVLKTGRFAAQADRLRTYRHIATMDRTAPLPPLRDQTPTWRDAATFAHTLGLEQLAKRLEALEIHSKK
jgi:exodeoxyribonuclease-3